MIEQTPPYFYFSLKAYTEGKGNLKFELDLADPFSTAPVPQGAKNYVDQSSLKKMDNVIGFIKNIVQLLEKDVDPKETLDDYQKQINALREMLKLSRKSKGGISRMLYEQHNPRQLSVSFDTDFVGNGDQRPPTFS